MKRCAICPSCYPVTPSQKLRDASGVKQSVCNTCGAELPDPDALCGSCLFDWAATDDGGLGSLGEFELVKLIQRGGMGIVYRARQLDLDREVALKVLPGAALLSPEARQRFRIEAETMARMNHPHILPVYHLGEDEETPYFSMKLAEGGSLAGRLKDYQGKWRAIAELMIKIAEAVHFAYERGVLHRDLKPGNVLFDDQGQVYVSDFGLAKVLGTDMGMTQSRHVLGTPWYSAPELAERGQADATIASDVWALGVVLYELLAGTRPFTAESPHALMVEIMEQPPPTLPAEVPRDLCVIVLKALEKSPARRYANAKEFAEDLSRWLAGEPIQAKPVGYVRRMWLCTKRNPTLAAVSLVVGIAMMISVSQWLWSRERLAQERDRATAGERNAEDALKESRRANAKLLRQSPTPGRRAGALELLRQAGPSDDLAEARSEWIAANAGFDFGAPHECPPCHSPPDRYRRESVSGNLRWLVCVDADHHVILRDVETNKVSWRHRVSDEAIVAVTDVTDDGGRVALGFNNRTVELWDTRTDQLLAKQTQQPWNWLESRAYGYPRLWDLQAATGKLAIALADGSVEIHSGPGLPVIRTPPVEAQVLAVSWAPGKDQVAVSRAFHKSATDIEVWQAATVTKEWSRRLPLYPCWSIGWDASATYVAASTSGDGEVAVVEKNGIASLCQPASISVERTQFVTGTNIALSFQSSGEIRAWDMISGATVMYHPLEARLMQVGSDGRAMVVVTGDGKVLKVPLLHPGFVQIWQPTSRVTTLTTGSRVPYSLTPSQELPLLVTRGTSNVALWDTRVGHNFLVWTAEARASEKVSVALEEPKGGKTATLYANWGDDGISRRSVRLDDKSALQVGEPELIEGTVGLELVGTHPSGNGLIVTRGGVPYHLVVAGEHPESNPLKPISLPDLPIRSEATLLFSQTGRYIFYRYGTGQLGDLLNGAVLPIQHNLPELNVVFSPDDTCFMTQTRAELVFMSIDERAKLGSYSRSKGAGTRLDELAISPDRKLAAVEADGRSIALLALPSCKKLLELKDTDVLFDMSGICFSANGKRLYVSGRRNVLMVWEVDEIRKELARIGLEWGK